MSTLTRTLAESRAEFVARQAADGGFESAEAYVQSLIASAGHEAARERMKGPMIEGIASGDPIPATDEFWRGELEGFDERHPVRIAG